MDDATSQKMTSTSSSKPLTVLQILPSLVSGGVERGTVELAGFMQQQGIHSFVASAGGGMVALLEDSGSTHITLPLDSKNPLTIWRNIRRIQAIIQTHHIDIVHARSRAPAWSAYLATKRTNAHFITTFHGTYGCKNTLKRWYNSVMLEGERVIAISEHIKTHVQTVYRFPSDSIRLIHRGVDLAQFDPARFTSSDTTALRKNHSIPHDQPLIFCPGRITRWKGQSVLLEALESFANKHPDTCFSCVLAGKYNKQDGYYQELVNAIEASPALSGNVQLIDAVSDIPLWYAASDVIIAPSTRPEAFGRIPIEAGAMKKRIIASNHGGFTETVKDQITGFLVTPSDADSLAKAIETCLTMQDQDIEKMTEAASTFANEHFSLEQMCRKTLTVYAEVMD